MLKAKTCVSFPAPFSRFQRLCTNNMTLKHFPTEARDSTAQHQHSMMLSKPAAEFLRPDCFSGKNCLAPGREYEPVKHQRFLPTSLLPSTLGRIHRHATTKAGLLHRMAMEIPLSEAPGVTENYVLGAVPLFKRVRFDQETVPLQKSLDARILLHGGSMSWTSLSRPRAQSRLRRWSRILCLQCPSHRPS